MKHQNTIFLAVVFFLLICCSKKTNDTSNVDLSAPVEKIDLEQVNNLLNEHVIINKYVKLENIKKSYLAEVSKVVSANGFYYILDRKYSSLKLFKNDGRYINDIGHIGQGPGEYLNADDFYVHNEKVYLLSNSSRLINIYDYKGKFEKSIPLHFFAFGMTNLEKDSAAFFVNYNTSEEFSNLLFTDKDIKVSKRYFPFVRNIPSFAYSGFLEKSENVLYSNPLSDSIFTISKGRVFLSYIVDLGSNKCPEEIKADPIKLDKKIMDISYVGNPAMETKNHFIFQFVKNRLIRYCIYNKKSKNTFVNKVRVMIDTFSGPLGYRDNRIISVILTENFLNSKNIEAYNYIKTKYPKLFQTLKSLDVTDNPVLVEFSVNSN
ncbi:6-bladed beta-propeller [Spirosoma flavum]|uniref:6-bladed beta-propeller n=1 Tax=Spirosoma flavum TaxID=2048557 RepID=A0ABW6AR08_9BACT